MHALASLCALLVLMGVLADRKFRDLSYSELDNALQGLDGKQAEFFQAKDVWPDVGTFRQRVDVNLRGGGRVCSPSILQVTHRGSHAADEERPQVLVSGEIHGNERIGPQATLFAGQLLVWAADCLIGGQKQHCDKLHDMGVSRAEQQWLAFLGSRRDTFIVPALNCLGYLHNRREDNGIDPNRDFPYGRRDDKCLRSGTAKVRLFCPDLSFLLSTCSNASCTRLALTYHPFDPPNLTPFKVTYLLMRSLLVQSVVTYHGGMVALGYEWGSLGHRKPMDKSPDDSAHVDMAQGMAVFGGKAPNDGGGQRGRGSVTAGRQFYHPNTINGIVYPVPGGMEDWCYAAGFDPALLRNCSAFSQKPFSNYIDPMRDPALEQAQVKAVVFLVETADAKQPLDATLGTPHKPLDYAPAVTVQAGAGGHIPRNARLALAAVDFAQPYVCLQSLDGQAGGSLKARWMVGGASTVSSTFLSLHAPPAQAKQVMAGLNKGGWTQLLRALVQPTAAFQAVDGQRDAATFAPGAEVYRVPSGGGGSSGAGRWKAKDFMAPDSFDASLGGQGAGGVSGLPDGTYWAVAWARVDERWGAEHQGSPQWQTPQTHASLLRTDPSYRVELDSRLRGPLVKRVVQGRLYWPSDPMVLTVKGGRATVVSSVLQCAWWHRLRH